MSDRALIARIAAHTRWAGEPDRAAATAPARKGLDAKWAREVDPDGVLPPAELARRVENLRQAHMTRMALASARARRAKAGAA
jgi:hypothetical protein